LSIRLLFGVLDWFLEFQVFVIFSTPFQDRGLKLSGINYIFSSIFIKIVFQGGRGHWAVYYTSPQSFIITFNNLLLKLFLIGWYVECPTFLWDIHQFTSYCLIPLDHFLDLNLFALELKFEINLNLKDFYKYFGRFLFFIFILGGKRTR
jgi:hypothetical protein